jgi:DNA-binding transcriptional LysR family regulator
MDKPLHTLDWSLIHAFLAVAETGSLSAAARALSLSQPTLGRQIKQIETQLGLTLFERQPRGLKLTPAGETLLEPASSMREAACLLSLRAAGQDQTLSGTVRITASEVMAHHVLPKIIAQMRRAEPQIQIELVPSDASENLLFRAADIAIRMYRSTQLDVITKQIGAAPLGVYAAKCYIAERGLPQSPDTLQGHDLVGYDRDDRIIQGMRALGFPATRDWFALRCDDQNTYWQLVAAGCGIGFAQRIVGDQCSDVTRVLPDLPLDPLPIWLAAPEVMRSTPRIRRVWDLLEHHLSQVFADPPVLDARTANE